MAGQITGQIAGRAVFVAGGSGVIGTAICRELAQRGALVAVHSGRRPEMAQTLATELGDGHLGVAGDLADADALERCVATASAAIGPIVALVNCYHPAHAPAPIGELELAVLDAQLAAVRAHAALCQQVLPSMRAAGWGRVVYIAGALMTRPAAGFAAYAAAKSAASTFTRYLALEEGRHGITANVIAPGRVVDPDDDTELSEQYAALAEQLRARMALGRFPSPQQVAALVCTVLDEVGDALTGQTLWVTGGEPIG